MSNVIRPTFGPGARLDPAAPPSPAPYLPLSALGSAGGYAVGLMRDENAPEGPVIKVVVSALG